MAEGKSKLTVSNLRNFFDGYYNLYNPNLPEYQKEQAELRAYLCSNCTRNGSCVHCGCKTPAMFFSPLKEDSETKWGKYLDEVQWEALKNNIDLYKAYFDELKERIRTQSSSDDGSDSGVSKTDETRDDTDRE